MSHKTSRPVIGGGLKMFLWSLAVLVLTFNKLIIHTDAFTCSKGERVHFESGRKSCKPCPDGTYQPAENPSQRCKACTTCSKGSFAKESCTKVSNAVCQCREGFIPRFENSAICKCRPGSGLNNGVCLKCEDGYFSTKDDTPCQPWNNCKETGIKELGSSTSDAVCNESNRNLQITTPVTAIRKTARTASPRPHEGNITLNPTSTTSPPPQKDKVPPHSASSNHTAMILFSLGIVGLLVWIAVTCKMHVFPCSRKKKMQSALKTRDSLCRRPVEESGDSSETPLKLNQEA